MLGYKRSARVGELLLQEISRIVQEFEAPGQGLITVTHVKLTDDLQDARIFYSVLGTEEQSEKTHQLMKDSLPYIRHQLAVRLNLRLTPRLSLEIDTTVETASRVFELLEKIKKESEEINAPAPAVVETGEAPEKKVKTVKKRKPKAK
jgi:ribosome-binding factor A